MMTESGESVLEQLINISDNANKAFISDLKKDEYLELARTLKIISSSIHGCNPSKGHSKVKISKRLYRDLEDMTVEIQEN